MLVMQFGGIACGGCHTQGKKHLGTSRASSLTHALGSYRLEGIIGMVFARLDRCRGGKCHGRVLPLVRVYLRRLGAVLWELARSLPYRLLILFTCGCTDIPIRRRYADFENATWSRNHMLKECIFDSLKITYNTLITV